MTDRYKLPNNLIWPPAPTPAPGYGDTHKSARSAGTHTFLLGRRPSQNGSRPVRDLGAPHSAERPGRGVETWGHCTPQRGTWPVLAECFAPVQRILFRISLRLCGFARKSANRKIARKDAKTPRRPGETGGYGGMEALGMHELPSPAVSAVSPGFLGLPRLAHTPRSTRLTPAAENC